MSHMQDMQDMRALNDRAGIPIERAPLRIAQAVKKDACAHRHRQDRPPIGLIERSCCRAIIVVFWLCAQPAQRQTQKRREGPGWVSFGVV